jgi:hypothetical protein
MNTPDTLVRTGLVAADAGTIEEAIGQTAQYITARLNMTDRQVVLVALLMLSRSIDGRWREAQEAVRAVRNATA